MKPNFALKLSNDGIELLHRVTGGWSPVGSVRFETDDVAEACEKLVSEAARREPGFRTKLVMPDDEVRYDAILAPGPTDEARRYQIEAEIERLTPYSIDDLAYDWSIEDDHALVVICARETLIEAETFAEGYGFNPVSFVAQPAPGQFAGEPFFGETMVAPTLLPPGAQVQPDAEPIRLVAPRKAEAPAKADSPAAVAPAVAPAAVSAAAPAKPQPAAAAVPAATVAAPAASLPPGTPPARPIPGGMPAAGKDAGKGGAGKAETGKAEVAKAEGGIARVGDLVRRMGTRLRREQAQAQKDLAPPAPRPSAPPSMPKAAGTLPAGAATPPQRPALAGAAPPLATGPINPAGQPMDKPGNAAGKSADTPPKPAPVPAPPEAAAPVAFASRRNAPQVVAASGPQTTPGGTPGGRLAVLPEGRAAGGPQLLSRARKAALSALAGVTAAAQAARARTRPARSTVTPPESPPAARPAPPAPSAAAPVASAPSASPSRASAADQERAREAEAMTIFGARGMQRNDSTLARRGLMAAGGALMLLVAVAIWALYFRTDGSTQLATGSGTSQVAGGEALPGIEAPARIAGEGEAVTAPAALPAPAAPGADALAAAPDALVSDPDQMLEALVQQGLDASLPTATLDPPIGESVTASPAETAATEAPPVSEAAQAPAIEPAGTGPAPAQAAEASDSPQVAAAESTVQRLSLPRGFEVPPVAEVAFTPPPAPPPFGTEFNFNAQGLVEATPEGALTPGGVTVFAGRPNVAPAPRPGTIAPEPEASLPPVTPVTEPVTAAIENAIAEAVGGALPAGAAPVEAAPEGIAETPSEDLAAEDPAVVFDDTPRADPALAGARPQPRPESVRAIGEQLEQEAGGDDQTLVIPQNGAETDTAAVSADPAALVAAASTVDTTATRAGDGAATTELAALTEATPGGLALAGLRPQRRPTDLAPPPQAEPEPTLDLTGATPEAVAQSPVPGGRPGDLAERARAILAAAAVQQAAPAAAAAAPAPAAEPPARTAAAASTAPSIPSSASVARAATEENAIRLNRVNLIGVFGSPNARRALVRLSNGRVVRVQVGDQLDGGQVAAIGDSELRYVKNGRNELLRIGS